MRMNGREDRSFALMRIVFGCVWTVDAYFKWQPDFLNNFVSYLQEGADGQPALVQWWINLWIHGVSVDPHLFALFVACAETAIAIGLVLGLFTRIALAGGIALALVIWTTAEGFGGPYVAGSTDIGTAIIYALLFIALWLGKCWRYYSLDSKVRRSVPFLVGRW